MEYNLEKAVSLDLVTRDSRFLQKQRGCNATVRWRQA